MNFFKHLSSNNIVSSPLGGDAVNLVDEEDAGRGLRRLLEQLPQLLLAVPGHARHDLGGGHLQGEGQY